MALLAPQIPQLTDLDSFERDALVLLSFVAIPQTAQQWAEWANDCRLRHDPVQAGEMAALAERFVALCLVDKSTIRREVVFEPSLSVPSLVLPEAHDQNRLSRLWATFNKVSTTPPWGSKRRPLNLHDWHTRIRVLIGELRVMLTFSNTQRVLASLVELERWSSFRGEFPHLLLDSLGTNPPEHWIAQLPDSVLDEYLGELVQHCTIMLSPFPRTLPVWAEDCTKPPTKLGVARLLALRGQSEQITNLGKLPKWGAEGAKLLAHFAAGDYAAAADFGDKTVATMKRKHKELPGLEGVMHALVRVATMESNPARAAAFHASLTEQSRAKVGYESCYLALAAFELASRSPTPATKLPLRLKIPESTGITWSHALVRCLCIHWLGLPLSKHASHVRPWLVYWHNWAEFSGYPAIARELGAVLALLDGAPPPALSLAAHYKQRKPWETILETLEASVKVAQVDASASAGDGGFRKHIVWEVALGQHAVDIKARLMTSARTTKGQLIPLTKLQSGELDYLTDADRRVIATVPVPAWRGYSNNSIAHNWSTLEALIDHPRVRRTSGIPLRLTRGQPTIKTSTEAGTTTLELYPPELALREVVLREVVAEHVEIYAQKPELSRVYDLFAQTGQLKIPSAGRERLLDSLAGLATSTELVIEGEGSLAGHSVDPDPRVVMQLQWNGSTFVAHAQVAPLGPDGPHFAPGDGPVKIVGRVATQMLACTRDPGEENRGYQAMLAACPTLDSQPEDEGRWSIHELDTALEVLLELHALGDVITLTWPLERRLGVPRELSNQDMRVAVESKKDWLQVDLELSVDEARVLGFKQLIDSRRGNGRFIALGDDQFVALTSDLRKRIDALENLGTLKKSGLEVHPVTLPLLEQIVAEPNALRADKQARARLDSLNKIASKTPRLPRGFQATLRDYQSEGFKWMARLAEAGLGAVLADDMGLGKTIQALALLCQRAKRGPALVVAPTSVVGNWLSEAERFAPRLRCHQLASSDDRAALMASLRGGDVLLCSYGLLVSETQTLTELKFASVVFDEAHALKNSSSQRAKAAFALTSEFRLSLTGTPIENHLGELWSVFRATVPGLLASEKRFEQRFTRPISQGQRERSRQLRAMIRPFMLRRTKAQVLDELPPRTEVTIRVTPGAAEKAYYEALRRDAVEQTKGIKTKGGKGTKAGQSRLKILALITKLRQAAVDPRLIDPEHGPPGAKIEALIRRLVDLRDEGHRALVFTQFLGSMDTIRQRLDQAGIEHLSFDGSTPAAQRTKVVDAFQAGEADVFVMSLKAGGVGINLTGADYVIHLDPWWNPAVEDQATGRAHRIGQQRPVTVYRLVTAGTIEEQILELHTSKRDLADDLLAGLDSAKKLDLDELRALLRAGSSAG